MSEKTTLDLICPKCKQTIENICLMTVDWMLENYCRSYIHHIDKCGIPTSTQYFGKTDPTDTLALVIA